jgi:hypothetical protein
VAGPYKIEPLEFRTATAGDTLAIKVQFRSDYEAGLFEREFAKNGGTAAA